jgi:transcriptional regulator with XRE-family HTH domain
LSGSVPAVQIDFGARLRIVRNSRKLSQEDLAALAGITRTYISDVERGGRNVSLTTIEKLAAALDCRLAELMPDWPEPKAAKVKKSS